MNALLLAILLMPTYFVGSFFTENGTHSEQLRVGTTTDGIALTELAFPSYTSAGPAIGYAQGPRAVRNPGFYPNDGTLHNGYLYLAHSETTQSTDYVQTAFQSIARSSDGLTWTPVYRIDFSVTSSLNTVWAPRWFKDPADGAIYITTAARNSVAAPGSNGMSCYWVKALNSTFDSWTAPALITTLPSGNDFGASGPVYDPNIVAGEGAASGSYFCNFVDGSFGTFFPTIYKSTTSPVSGYVPWLTGNWTAGGGGSHGFVAGVDSPTWMKWNGVWRLYCDIFATPPRGEFYADITTGNWQTDSNQSGGTAPLFTNRTQLFWPNAPTDVRATEMILNPFGGSSGTFANVFASVIR